MAPDLHGVGTAPESGHLVRCVLLTGGMPRAYEFADVIP